MSEEGGELVGFECRCSDVRKLEARFGPVI
jgi:hypothetical protein